MISLVKFKQLACLRSPAFKLYSYLLLASENGVLTAPQRELSKEAHMSTGSITYAIGLLVKSEFIKVESRRGRIASTYVLLKEN
ncbi:MAG: hypothetical protein UY48_C0038G0012 [Candidatus Gottesmanbacteria bacterium GW2011_GWB1_49_7]|uniref:Uncharacterized protein n=1 Tax=Candidatus Gottesmanbacteria bacterium GW2011_GWB1_49_7 TaxID=1618448 RepID=A0A0G1Y697_9BACT|nr:MAG: hypothetical protein UY48_C0038G0012 [Candidatus Gottesmanbacteria bacterium GW2011_GWB1_49_7]